MLTFEKILKVFQAYLDDDPLYEVVQTSHGYTLMAWEPHRNDWYSAEIQKTPEDLRNALLSTYANFLEDKITGNDCDLTVTETEKSSRGVGNFWKSAGNLDIEMPEGGRDYASSFCFAVCSILSAPSMAPSIIGRYCSGQSFSLLILNVGKIPPFNPNHFCQCFSCQTLCLSCGFDICTEGFKTGTIFN